MKTIDFETEGIEGNPIYAPPKPVGVSIKHEDEPSHYLAWGHPTENNCSFEDGRARLMEALEAGEWLGHNSAFECAILRDYFQYVPKDPKKVHDTQFLIYLHDPYAFSFALKASAERILGLPPDEQTRLKDWILRNVPEAKEKDWGAYICKAPGSLVGEYAEGDTDRTKWLYDKLRPEIEANGMWDAYVREQMLAPILSAASQRGVRLDTERLEHDIPIYEAAQKKADEYIFTRLGEFDLAKDAQLADALDRAGQITEWVLTPTGRRSVARKNLVGRVRDPLILANLAYRGVLETCLGTFAGPWLAQARREKGRVHPQWNQVKGDKGQDGDMSGTRTGRMSCKAPNLQNPPNDFEELVIPEGLPNVMQMRSYLLPDEGHVWLKRDYAAQEMRIMAHFAEGKLFEAFKKNPKTDPHAAVKTLIEECTGIVLPRKHVKITGFGIMYGRGIASTAAALGISDDEGRSVRDAYFAALPEIRSLSAGTRNRGRNGGFIRTWGGRIYYREPNAERDLSYKLLNYLIQGSAADQTKEGIIHWNHLRKSTDVFLAAVHDEMDICAPIEDADNAMFRLKEAMDAPRFDVPFASDGFAGPNWADILPWKDE